MSRGEEIVLLEGGGALCAPPLASNPGPHHFDLLDLREEGLWKLPAILEIVRSMDRFDRSFSPFFTLTVARVRMPCYEMSRAYITGLQLVGFCEHRHRACKRWRHKT